MYRGLQDIDMYQSEVFRKPYGQALVKGGGLRRPLPAERAKEVSELVIISGIMIGIVMAVVLIVAVVLFLVRRRLRLSDDEMMREEENQAYLELNSDEQELYFQSKDYLAANPYLKDELTLSQNLAIQEKGVGAFQFQKDAMLTNSDLMIVNKCELNFFKRFECSTQTNLPMPMKNDVYYFESKLYSVPHPDETTISIGLGIKPYPWFRLPGRHSYSISYDSDGHRRHGQPFDIKKEAPFPKLIEGDVVGIGYRVRSGTVFFTRNGKKVSESKIGGHIRNFKIPQQGQIFPTIGANNLCSIHVNLGQMGFVFIEGIVKKWGFAPLEGTGPAPPAYNKFNSDILLERSEVDDENDLSDRENDFPPDFWETRDADNTDDEIIQQDKFSYNAYSDLNSTAERITLKSIEIPNKPPSYNSDGEETSDRTHASPPIASSSQVSSVNSIDNTAQDLSFEDAHSSSFNVIHILSQSQTTQDKNDDDNEHIFEQGYEQELSEEEEPMPGQNLELEEEQNLNAGDSNRVESNGSNHNFFSDDVQQERDDQSSREIPSEGSAHL